MKRFAFKFLGLVAAIWAVPLLGAFLAVAQWNDARLDALAKRVTGLPHPGNTAFVARHGDIGNAGNGNHLDFWVVELRSFIQGKAQVQSAYRAVRVAVPNDADDDFSDVKNGTQPVEVEILPSPLPANYELKCGNIPSWSLRAFAGKRDLYVVKVLNSGANDDLATLFDWRGS